MELIEGFELKGKRAKVKGLLCSLVLLLMTATATHAQTFAEWFQQGKTQIKYLTQQIAALNAFQSSVRQGYQMMKNEWGSISNFKNGEFGLHQDYYSSLSQVNPVVRKSTDITSMEAEQQSIISQFNATSGLTGLSVSEQNYINSVGQQVMAECAKDLTDLQTVLTSGQLVMSDDERIIRINQLAAAIKDKYLFACNFTMHVRLLAIQRNQDNNEAQTLNNLYGINN
jgi:hypothetical protein